MPTEATQRIEISVSFNREPAASAERFPRAAANGREELELLAERDTTVLRPRRGLSNDARAFDLI